MVESHVTILSSTDRIISAPETTTLPTENPCDIVTVIVRMQGYKKGDTNAPLSQDPTLALSPSETEISTVPQDGSAVSSDPGSPIDYTTITSTGTDTGTSTITEAPSGSGPGTVIVVVPSPSFPYVTVTDRKSVV